MYDSDIYEVGGGKLFLALAVVVVIIIASALLL